MNTKTVAIFGATGFSGRSVLSELLARGHRVRALARRPAALETHTNLTTVEGNALDPETVAEVLTGTDAVIHCLGVGGKGNGAPTTLVSESVQLILDALGDSSSQRLICMSNVGAGDSGTFLAKRVVVPLFVRWLLPIIEDKDRMEAALQASKTDWLAVRFPNIVEGPAKDTKSCPNGRKTSLSITTESLARYLVDQLSAERIGLRTPSVSN